MADIAHSQRLVWEGLLNAHYASLYYFYLANRLARKEQRYMLAVMIGSSGVLAALFASLALPSFAKAVPYVSAVLSFVTALVGTMLFSGRPGRLALLSLWEAYKWDSIRREYEILWGEIGELDAATAAQRWRELERRGSQKAEAAPVEFPKDDELRRLAREEVLNARGLSEAKAA